MTTRKIDTLTDDAKLDILDAGMLLPVLEEIETKLTDLETRLRALETSKP